MPTSAERAEARRRAAQAQGPAPAPANDDDLTSLTREKAAAWFAERGIDHMTADRLRQDASRRQGPRYYTIGRVPYYRLTDLRAWLREAQAAASAA